MKTKFSGILTLLLAFVVQISFAQQKTISGTVTDQSGLPLPGVNIIVKGTTNGTQSDFDGNYTIKANAGEVLSFTYLGLQLEEATVTSSSVINVTMKEDLAILDEVVVTAQGVKREKKALGYAVSSVKAERIEQKAEGDVMRILAGKSSGVDITQTSGTSGSATNIIIRGYSSISGSNQPLFIVDGILFSGDTNSQGNFADGQTQSSRFLDLDPNSIDNISVLKGLAATTVYGQQGRNGVILITTKAGNIQGSKKKNEITFSQSVFFNEIASLPEYQNDYGSGFQQNFGFFFSNWGPNFNARGERGIASDGTVAHPFSAFQSQSNKDAFPELSAPGSRYDYKAYANVEKFFRTGTINSASINIAGTTDKVSYNVSYGNLNDQGFTPGNSLRRDNFSFGGKAELTNNFTVTGTINYAITNYKTPPIAASLGSGVTGAGASIFGDVFYTPRSVDLNGLPFQNPVDGSSVYYRSGNDIQNPNWTIANARDSQKVNRIFGGTTLNYKLNDNINLSYRVGIDNFNTINESYQNKGGVDGATLGFLQTSSEVNTIWDHTFLASFNYNLSDAFDLNFDIAANSRKTTFSQQGVYSTDQIVFGVIKHFNFRSQSNSSPFSGNIQFDSVENILGIYSTAVLDYKDMVYLTVSARNDWASTLESENNNLLYPSASLSLMMTNLIPGIKDIGLDYLKLRGGYGESAGFPSPYSTRNNLSLNSQAFVNVNGEVISTNEVSNRLGNADLKPESIAEIEIGLESKFWKNRAGLDVSVYKKKTDNLITDRELDRSTGFSVTRINAGELETKGIEIDLSLTPIQTEDFNWTLIGNFSAYESTILKLPDGIDQLNIAGFTNLGNFAIEGQPYGVIQGNAVQRDINGNAIIDDAGNYVVANDISIIGDPNPDWTSNLVNTFSYKGFSLSFDWSYRHGGDIYSRSAAALVGRGITSDTNFDRDQAYILPGVTQTGVVNTKLITATNLYFDNLGFGGEDLKVWDGSTIRLRDISLSYRLSSKMLEKTPFGSISFTVSGQNMWYEAVNFPKGTNFDTNVVGTGVGNGLGLDFLNGPSSKRYGFSVKATF